MADPTEGQSQEIQEELFREAVAPEPPAQPEPQPQPAPEPTPPAEPEASIPSWRLREESEARRVAERRAQQLEDHLNRLSAHVRQNQPQKDFFDDPGSATSEMIARALGPYAEETRRNLMYMGKMIAESKHGEDALAQAESAFLEAVERQTLDVADYEGVVTAPNRYDAVVRWHKRQSVLASVGDDPNAWFERQLEAKMNDPAFQAKVIEKARGGAANRPANVELPPSLSRATAAAGNGPAGLGDLSHDSLFAFSTKP